MGEPLRRSYVGVCWRYFSAIRGVPLMNAALGLRTDEVEFDSDYSGGMASHTTFLR